MNGGVKAMHLKSVTLHPAQYPDRDHYPFNLPVFNQSEQIIFNAPVTLFVGENGTGKSTLIQALARACGIHIWQDEERKRAEYNPYEDKLSDCMSIEWVDGPVQGSFFGSSVFQDFVRILDDWAAVSPGLLQYFGGQSLMTQSHGQSIMSFFKARYQIKGLYLLDEPETALSPKTQFKLLELLMKMGRVRPCSIHCCHPFPDSARLPGGNHPELRLHADQRSSIRGDRTLQTLQGFYGRSREIIDKLMTNLPLVHRLYFHVRLYTQILAVAHIMQF